MLWSYNEYFRAPTEVWNFITNTSRIINTFDAFEFTWHSFENRDPVTRQLIPKTFSGFAGFSNPIVFPVDSNFCDAKN